MTRPWLQAPAAAALVLASTLSVIWPTTGGAAAVAKRASRHGAAQTISPPSGQWLAMETVLSSTGMANAPVGSVDVRAWLFATTCSAGSCRTEMTRQIAAGTDATELLPNDGGYIAIFPPIAVNCVEGTPGRLVPGEHGMEHDRLTLQWTAKPRGLSGAYTSIVSGCGSTVGAFSSRSSAAPVVPPPAPAIKLNPSHVATAGAFVAGADRVCARVSSRLRPIDTAIASATTTIRTTSSRATAATAAATAATLIPELVPLAATEFGAILQPPPGPSAVLWREDVALNRRAASPASAYAAAVGQEFTDVRRYLLTKNQLAIQDGAAYATLASFDAVPLKTLGTASDQLEHRLGLSQTCINGPWLATPAPHQ